MYHFFDDDIAVAVGVNGALLLTRLHYWLKKNADNETHYHDGHYWTYNSVAAFKKQFPFWSERTISYELKKLEKEGWIKTGNYNASVYNRTKWYTLTEKALTLLASPILQNCEMEDEENENSNIQKVQIAFNTSCNTDFAKMSNDNKQNCQMSFDKNVKTTIDKINNKGVPKKETRPKTVDVSTRSQEFQESWGAFLDMRQAIRKPATERAQKLIIDKLQKLAPDNEAKQIEILNRSTMNNWRDVFPLEKYQRGNSNRNQSAAEQAEEIKREMRERGLLGDRTGTGNDDRDAHSMPAWLS